MSKTNEEVTLPGENTTVDDQQNQEQNTSTGTVAAPSVEAGTDDIADKFAAAQAEIEQLRTQNAELTPLAQAAREAEEANKTELQKLTEQRETLAAEKAHLESENTRLSLAAAYGLATEDLGLLGAGTPEEMEANAKRLQELHAAAMKPDGVPSIRPVESLKPGNSNNKPNEDAAYPAHWAV